MESQRSFLIIGLALVSFLLWNQWQADYAPQTTNVPAVSSTEVADTGSDQFVPAATDQGSDVPGASAAVAASSQLIEVKTDTLHLFIDPKGGDIVGADLLKFPIEQNQPEPYHLLARNEGQYHIAQSGLIGKQGPDASAQGRPLYGVSQQYFELSGDELIVPLTYVSSDGLSISKEFVFNRGQHHLEVRYRITNTGGQLATLQQYAQLKQSLAAPESSMLMPTYRGGAYSTQSDRYVKYEFDDIQDTNLKVSTQGGWVAMLEHYFVSAWIPPQEHTNRIYSRARSSGHAILGYTGPVVSVAPGESKTLSSSLYLGPKDQDTLAQLAKGLDLTVDYGVLFWISQPLFSLLSFIHSLVGNWGLAIIIITIIVKGAMYPLTKAQYTSMAKLRAIQPKMASLKERYGDDKQKFSQAMMELYKKEKVNPMGGCFPLLLQMPIFLALYWVFLESVELRHAPFFGWIHDLSVMDPYFVLPVLTGASMYLLQKLQPMTIQDPMQQKIMQYMPVAMSIFFLWFPAGLVLYWLVSNVITLIQAKIIYSQMDKKGVKR